MKTPHILVVDDEQLMLDVTVAVLRKMGMTAETANNPKTGFGLFEACRNSHAPFDLVITDLKMQGDTFAGYHLAQEIRKLHATVPVIISTGEYARIEPQHMAMAQEHGAHDIIAKPFKLEEFKGMIRLHLGI